MSENARLLYHLIQALEEEEWEGLLLLVDFEKAFDSLEWPFIDRILTFFNFGESVKEWIKIFYTDILGAMAYNRPPQPSFLLVEEYDRVTPSPLIYSSYV